MKTISKILNCVHCYIGLVQLFAYTNVNATRDTIKEYKCLKCKDIFKCRDEEQFNLCEECEVEE